jgi:predicted PolB exonuclease-like 3'-5' exonuclease
VTVGIATYQLAFIQTSINFEYRYINVLAFDIETIPDVDGGRALHDLDGLVDSDVAEAMFQLRREKKLAIFCPLTFKKSLLSQLCIATQ